MSTSKHKKRRSRSKRSSGLVDSSSTGKQTALQLVSGGSRGLRLYYPKALPPGAQFVSPPRAYTIKSTRHRKFQAYRMVISIGAATGHLGEFIGLQGTGWRNPPILRSPTATKKIDGRVFLLYRDGARTRLVAWRSDNAAYWVSNTLSESLSERQLLAIAHAAKPLG